MKSAQRSGARSQFHLRARPLGQIHSCPRAIGRVLPNFWPRRLLARSSGCARRCPVRSDPQNHRLSHQKLPRAHQHPLGHPPALPGALLNEGFLFKPRADFATHPAEFGNGVPMATAAPGTNLLRDAAGCTNPQPCPASEHFLPFATHPPRNFRLQIKSDSETNCRSWEGRGGHHLLQLRKMGKICDSTPKWHRCCCDRHDNAEGTRLSLEFPSWAGPGAGPSSPSPQPNPRQDLSLLTLPRRFSARTIPSPIPAANRSFRSARLGV